MTDIFRWLRRLREDRRGSLLVEFAMIIPVMTALLMGGVEVARFAQAQQKLDRVVGTLGDVLARAEVATQVEIDKLFAATAHIANPFDLTSDGVVILSSIGLNGAAVEVLWQAKGGGGLVADSVVGLPGAGATLPNGMTVSGAQTVIVAEVYYDYVPLFLPHLVPATRLYHQAFFRPRLASLSTLQ